MRILPLDTHGEACGSERLCCPNVPRCVFFSSGAARAAVWTRVRWTFASSRTQYARSGAATTAAFGAAGELSLQDGNEWFTTESLLCCGARKGGNRRQLYLSDTVGMERSMCREGRLWVPVVHPVVCTSRRPVGLSLDERLVERVWSEIRAVRRPNVNV